MAEISYISLTDEFPSRRPDSPCCPSPALVCGDRRHCADGPGAAHPVQCGRGALRDCHLHSFVDAVPAADGMAVRWPRDAASRAWVAARVAGVAGRRGWQARWACRCWPATTCWPIQSWRSAVSCCCWWGLILHWPAARRGCSSRRSSSACSQHVPVDTCLSMRACRCARSESGRS